MAFLLRVVQDPATSQWPALTSSYERSYSGHSYAAESKNPLEKTNKHQSTVKYMAGKSILFISDPWTNSGYAAESKNPLEKQTNTKHSEIRGR